MKSTVQRLLQKLLGFKRYLWWFTQYKLAFLHKDKSERDFFHFVHLLPSDATVLDIGANLGLMSYYLSKKTRTVHAFEPIPYNAENLKRLKQSRNLSNLTVHELALGEEEGEIELILPLVDGVRKQGLSHVKHDKMEVFNEGERYRCRVERLDDFLKVDRLDGIKIDVENFEFEVFKGSEQTIKKHKPLIYCELWENQNRKDCFDLFEEWNYSVQFLSEGKLIPFDSATHVTQNFFFVPKA